MQGRGVVTVAVCCLGFWLRCPAVPTRWDDAAVQYRPYMIGQIDQSPAGARGLRAPTLEEVAQ